MDLSETFSYSFPVITWTKKHSPKQVLSIIYILGKELFPAATFKGLCEVSFQTKQKNLQYTLICMTLLCLSREEKIK